MDMIEKIAIAAFAAVHVWVAWELWAGRTITFTRWPSDPDGWGRATQLHRFDRKEEPGFYWMAWGYKAIALALFWGMECL